MKEYRIEHDVLGEKKIPSGSYWGIHTQRAVENFALSGKRVNPRFIKAIAWVKKACCAANEELGYLDRGKAGAIVDACDEIIEGRLDGQFPVDALQGGAGTSTNMNVNEVIANRAIELLGGAKGDYGRVHPIDDVNLHQSTNDVYPTALKIAALYALRELSPAIAQVQGAFQRKEKEFADVVTIARTEMQPAVPITLGAEFCAYAEAFSRDRWRVFKCEERIRVVNIGGTAVGTGLTAPRPYIFMVIEKLREITGLGLARSENMVDATTNMDALVEVSGILKAHAVNLIKVSNDLRLLNLLGEITLPPSAAGSSIMAGKVNPVICEAVVQAGMAVIANDGLVTQSACRGTLQINEFLPLLACALLESLDMLLRINTQYASHVEKIIAHPEVCRGYLETNPVIVTAFLPHIGYECAEALMKEFSLSGRKNVREFLNEKLGKDLVDTVLRPANLVSLGHKGKVERHTSASRTTNDGLRTTDYGLRNTTHENSP